MVKRTSVADRFEQVTVTVDEKRCPAAKFVVTPEDTPLTVSDFIGAVASGVFGRATSTSKVGFLSARTSESGRTEVILVCVPSRRSGAHRFKQVDVIVDRESCNGAEWIIPSGAPLLRVSEVVEMTTTGLCGIGAQGSDVNLHAAHGKRGDSTCFVFAPAHPNVQKRPRTLRPTPRRVRRVA